MTPEKRREYLLKRLKNSIFFFKLPLFIFIMICFWSFFGCPKPIPVPTIPASTAVTIEGKVTNPTGDTLIAGVNVSTIPPTSTVSTNEQGYYIIDSIPPGQYMVTASKSGYAPDSVKITVSAGQTATANLAVSLISTKPPVDLFAFKFQSNDYWEFDWKKTIGTFSISGSGSSTTTGKFRITLTQPAIISGDTGYRAVYSGDTSNFNGGETRWKFLALRANQILGSSDSMNWVILFDPQTGQWPGTGFFIMSGSTVLFQSSSKNGLYTVSKSTSTSNCQYFSGVGTICGDQPSTGVSESESFSTAKGFQGFQYTSSYSTLSSGGDYSSTTTITVNLTDYSLDGTGQSSIPAYTLTATAVPSAGGTITFSPAGGTYDTGSVVTLRAVASPGYAFSDWNGDSSKTRDSMQVVMTGNLLVTANFLQKAVYNYTFLDSTDARMQVWINNVLYDTVPAQDSVTIPYSPDSYPVSLLMKPIVAVGGWDWRDTIRSARNYHNSFYAGNDFFFLRLTNNTDAAMTRVVVRNSRVHDSSAVSLPIGSSQDIGFYLSDTSTYIAAYYSGATYYQFWDSLNTVNTVNYALLESLIASGSVLKIKIK